MQVILTKHARERLSQRGMTINGVEETIYNCDKKIILPTGETKFIKQQGSRLYQAVAIYKEKEHAWLVLSVWVRGEEDRPDLLWLIITAPFKWLWKLGKFIFRLLFGWH